MYNYQSAVCLGSNVDYLDGVLGLDVSGVHERHAVAAFRALEVVLLRLDRPLKRQRVHGDTQPVLKNNRNPAAISLERLSTRNTTHHNSLDA